MITLMTLENNSTISWLVADIPQFIQTSIKKRLGPLHALITNQEQRLATVEARGNSNVIYALRTDLNSLYFEFQCIKPFFTLHIACITIPQVATGLILPFVFLFRHPTLGDEIRIDFSKWLTEDQLMRWLVLFFDPGLLMRWIFFQTQLQGPV